MLLKMLTLKRMMKYFFVAGHYHYARYLTQYLLEWSCLNEDDKVNLVCRHNNGVWNAVSADQFGEQTAIRIGKGSLKGMTLSPELVSEWIDSFPITAHISDCMNHIYKDDIPKSTSMKPHKEELRHHRSLDTYDRNLIYTEVEKYSHPLDADSPHLFNPITTMNSFNDSAFDHDEADVTMVSYVLDATRHEMSIVQIVSDDTDVFLLLVYWVYKASIQSKIRMERWDGMILDINATCANLGLKCLQLLGMYALSGCDTTSYPYGKGKIRALNTLLSEEFPGLADIGEVSMTKEDLLQAALPFFRTLYQQPPETSMESARFNLFAKKRNTPKIMALPPTSDNLSYHVLRAHLQVILWRQQINLPHLVNPLILQTLAGRCTKEYLFLN